MNEKHLKPHQLARQQKYTDARTQMPVQNMAYKDKAPFISIIGPKDSGKDKLFELLVNTLTKKSNLQIDNIITIANSQKKITIHKSQETLNSYIDAIKVADLVILTIDANNMKIDTFEIISLLKVHGMSKVIVVADNADRKNIKVVKKRIWKEITPGIKVYNIDIKSEIDKLAREIQNMKYRPLQFRCNNSYIIADKIQFEENNAKFDYHFYGYIRGCPLRATEVHIPGNGDFEIASKEVLDDPCSVFTKKLLEKEKRNSYAPRFLEQITYNDNNENNEEVESLSEEFELFNNTKIKMKESSNDVFVKEANNINQEESFDSKEYNTNDLDDLLNNIADKFEVKAETEDDFVQKFNENNQHKDQLTMREAHMVQELKNKDLTTDFVPGQYVKITLKGIDKLKLGNLVILGSLNFITKTVLQGRVKKLNHFIHLLKSNEHYLISLGWRRESIKTIFSLKDPTRNKFLKYILEDAHCNVNFESNVIEPGTTFCIIKEKQMLKDNKQEGYKATENMFRIAAQGTITDVSGRTNLVKKLKLIGYPLRIEEQTTFVKDMFSSDLEVTKFEGALLKTVGGVRGCVKKAVGKNGDFRATFEGRLLNSDIIVLKCYVPYTFQDHDNINFVPKVKVEAKPKKNMTKIIEDKKERQHNYKVKQAEKLLTIDKRCIIEDFTIPQMPKNDTQRRYTNLKDDLNKKRQILQDHEVKRVRIESQRLEKEKLLIDKERKDKLKKTIIERNAMMPGKTKHKHHNKKTKSRK